MGLDFGKGAVLLAEGEVGSRILFLVEGECTVSKRHPATHEPIKVSELQVQDTIGLGLVSHAELPSQFTFRAKTPIKAYSVSKNNLKNLPRLWNEALLALAQVE